MVSFKNGEEINEDIKKMNFHSFLLLFFWGGGKEEVNSLKYVLYY